MKDKILLFTLGFLLMAVFIVEAKNVGATPSQIMEVKSAAATTTLSFITPTVSTSTVPFDTQSDGGFVTDSARLAVQFTASSTSSTLNWVYEYAMNTPGVDCTTALANCDWYTDETIGFTNASTTVNIAIPKIHSWKFASSTIGGISGNALNNRDMKMIDVPTPVRYVRAVFSMPVGSTNGAVWAAFEGKKQK